MNVFWDTLASVALTAWMCFLILFLLKCRCKILLNQDFVFMCFLIVSGLSSIPMNLLQVPFWYHTIAVIFGLALMHALRWNPNIREWYHKPSKYLNRGAE